MSAFAELKSFMSKMRIDIDEHAKAITKNESKVNQLLENEKDFGSDPYALKQIAMLKEETDKIRKDLDSVILDLSEIKQNLNQDKTVMETIIYQKLEQNMIKLINSKLQNQNLENV